MKKIILSLGLLLISLPAQAMGIINLTAQDAPALLGTKVEEIRVYQVDDLGALKVIPFQVDEKVGAFNGSSRSWALDQGKKSTNGVFEKDEVILWAQKDGGAKLSQINRLQNFKQLLEISVNPGSGPYFYVGLTSSAPKSANGYMQYTAAQDQIKAPGYEVSFDRKHPLVQEVLKIANGAIPYDILDRFKARFFLDVKKFFNFKFDEEGIKAKVIGNRSGPIRIIRSVQASKSLGPIKLIPKSRVDFYFYPYWFSVPTKINNPVEGDKFLNSKTTGFSGFDFNSYVLGSELKTNLGSIALRLDGKNSGELKKISGEKLRWWSLSGVSGSMVQSIQNDSKLRALGIHPYLILINDSKRSAPPEDQVGEVFIGFDLPYHKIPKGNYAIQVKQVFPLSFQPGLESVYLQEARLITPQYIKKIK